MRERDDLLRAALKCFYVEVFIEKSITKISFLANTTTKPGLHCKSNSTNRILATSFRHHRISQILRESVTQINPRSRFSLYPAFYR